MGVSGCGKTTIGQKLASELNISFFDADDFHPESNVQKMSNGIALNDEDRLPWLLSLNKLLQEQQNNGAILACSALKESYRNILSKDIDVEWVYLNADFDLIKKRMLNRSEHYMPVELLYSQFETLEEPEYGIHINVILPPKEIITKIKEKLTSMNQSSFGVYGLGVMGKSLALNILDKGFSLSVFNIETEHEQGIVDDFLESTNSKKLKGFTNTEKFISSLESPRKILLMVKAGEVVDLVVDQLAPYLDKGDIIIDGGNSHFLDTKRRTDSLLSKEIHFVGMGVSGGEEGALKGPSLMPSGNIEAYNKVAPILEAIASKDKTNKPCCTYIGTEGAGHFVKMVHNGIEYGEMQLLAELYTLLSEQLNYDEIASLFEDWNKGELSSYLLEITAKILRTKEGEDYLLDKILDKAGNKGTGAWSSVSALETGIPTTVKTAAVFARYVSSFKAERVRLSKYTSDEVNKSKEVDVEALKEAYDFARTINTHQGLTLIKQTSDNNNWNINLSEVLRIWTNGCIIKSEKLNEWRKIIKNNDSLLLENTIVETLKKQELSVSEILKTSLTNRIAIPCIWAAYNYWIGMTTKNSSANMIQAQRDFFGAHTYQRIDKDESQFFHTSWLAND